MRRLHKRGIPAAVFSQRLPWHLPTNPLTAALEDLRQREQAVCDLTIANPTIALPQLYDDAIRRALASLGSPSALRYEPTPRGLLPCRQAIAAYYARRGIDINPEHLMLCASTSEAYSWLFQLLCDPGDGVLFPQPSYPLIDHLAQLSSVQVVPYALRFCGDHFALDAQSLEGPVAAQIGTQDPDKKGVRTRALVSISPNNPTGSVLQRSDLITLHAACRTRNLALIVDEVFSDYLFTDHEGAEVPRSDEDSQLPSVLCAEARAIAKKEGQAAPLTFVLSGLSKVLGLPQLKLGWIHISGPEPLRTQAQDRLELIADTFLSVSTPVQLAAPDLLAQQPRLANDIRQHLQHNLKTVKRALAGSALSVLPVDGGWYAVLRLPAVLSEEDWALRFLIKDRVLVHPGYFFDLHEPGKAFAVISLLTATPDFLHGVRSLRDRVTQELSRE